MIKHTDISTKHMQLSKANNALFVIVMIASVIISFSLVFINILWGQSRFNSRIHSAKEQAKTTLEDNLTAIVQLQDSFIDFERSSDIIPGQGEKTNSAVILDALPSKYDYPALTSSIDRLVAQSDVKLISLSGTDVSGNVEQSSNAPQPVEIPFVITVEGSYANVNQLIANLENTIRPMYITQLTLTGSDSNMTANIEISTYYQPSIDLSIQMEEIN